MTIFTRERFIELATEFANFQRMNAKNPEVWTITSDQMAIHIERLWGMCEGEERKQIILITNFTNAYAKLKVGTDPFETMSKVVN